MAPSAHFGDDSGDRTRDLLVDSEAFWPLNYATVLLAWPLNRGSPPSKSRQTGAPDGDRTRVLPWTGGCHRAIRPQALK